MNKLLNALRAKLGDCDQDGDEYNFECPRCSNGKRKLGVNLRRMKYHCFKCHWGGWVSDLLDYLGLEAGDIALVPGPAQKEEPRLDVPLEIPGFRLIGTDPDSEIEKDILQVCLRRGKLGKGQIASRGWGYSQEKYLFGRLIVPVYTCRQLVQYLARSVYSYVEPKEKCGPTGLGWWPKTDIVYGADDVPAGQDIVLVEGLWDYEAVRRADHACLSLIGTQLGDFALGTILAQHPRRLILMFDGDWAGAQATVKLAEKIRTRHFTQIYVARPPAGKDPDELSPEELDVLVKKSRPYFSWLLANTRLSKSFKQ